MRNASRRSVLVVCAVLGVALTLAGCQSVLVWGAQVFWRHSPPEVPEHVEAIRDAVFAERPTGALALDVYRPADRSAGPRPVVLYAFGGGWMSGNRHQIVALDLLRLVDRGYALVTADYRWSTDAVFPAQIHDVKAALRWIRAHADEHDLDAERVAILGPSAGGHLAALAGTSGDVWPLEGATPDTFPDESSRVQAVVDYFGPTALTGYREQHVQNGLGSTDSLIFIDLLVGGPIDADPDLTQSVSPLRYVDPSDPPFLIIHGDADPVVPIQQSEQLVAALERAGVEATLVVVEGGDHGTSDEYASEKLFEEIVLFLDRSLGVSR